MLRDNAEGKVIDGKKVSLDDIKKAMLEADNGLFGKISGKISTDETREACIRPAVLGGMIGNRAVPPAYQLAQQYLLQEVRLYLVLAYRLEKIRLIRRK